MLPVVVVHGGAGHIPKDRAEASTIGVKEAASTGYALLQRGGSAMDAVVEAVALMETNPRFNAGLGSVLNVKGEVEMDALVMDGTTLGSGAVSAVRRIANPVRLARLVMEKTNHLCLTAEGASKFARSMGVPEVPEESLITDYAKMRWKKNLEPDANPNGNIACATSTGGMLNKMEGRVGDTPCVGCGGYADNKVGAVSPTGKTPEEASDLALRYMKERVEGLGGVVVVNPNGTWAARFSSLQMSWAAAQQSQLHFGLFHGEHFVEPIQDQT
ncbi:hypothetical protein DNTS_026443 [Danionella cerebrum]|uniref:Isoaspartyl peptidase/L-asparaginase n=1 Tax=Danionella cerebrum TaxID=2873325 RepID=A0A553R0R0_9TELE|nr:hypothetical protein DNTS_026443 [Danionella translucida]